MTGSNTWSYYWVKKLSSLIKATSTETHVDLGCNIFVLTYTTQSTWTVKSLTFYCVINRCIKNINKCSYNTKPPPYISQGTINFLHKVKSCNCVCPIYDWHAILTKWAYLKNNFLLSECVPIYFHMPLLDSKFFPCI